MIFLNRGKRIQFGTEYSCKVLFKTCSFKDITDSFDSDGVLYHQIKTYSAPVLGLEEKRITLKLQTLIVNEISTESLY